MGEPAKWIKISTDTFEDEKIDILEGMPSGDEIIVVWFKLLLLAGKCNSEGYLLIQDDIPFDEAMLARRFKKDINIIKLALGAFAKYKMIQITEKGIYITNFNKYQDLDRLNQKRKNDRERQQRKRDREKLLLETTKEEVGAGENNMSRVTSRNLECDNQCENERDSSYSSSYSYSLEDTLNNNNTISNIDNSKSDANIGDYIKFFNNNFHLISPYEKSILNSFESDGMAPEVITLALIEGVGKDLRYVTAILQNWLEKNIKTPDDVKADKEEFKRSKSKKKTVDNDKVSEQAGKKLKFTDYEQRQYDYDSLERKLLGWDKDVEES